MGVAQVRLRSFRLFSAQVFNSHSFRIYGTFGLHLTGPQSIHESTLITHVQAPYVRDPCAPQNSDLLHVDSHASHPVLATAWDDRDGRLGSRSRSIYGSARLTHVLAADDGDGRGSDEAAALEAHVRLKHLQRGGGGI